MPFAIPRITDFKTRNGRKVQDGGGVLPDIEIAALRSNDLTDALVYNNVVFDFATDYYYKNKVADPNTFTFAESDFQNFKSHVAQSDFSFETKTEKTLKEALTNREEVIFNDAIENDFKALLADINKSKIIALDTYQKEIRKNLEDEIIKRYFYREGLYDYYLSHDEAILAATELLGNDGKYSDILR